ncbi:MAG: hypothetical protein ACLFTD_05380 [Halochromatium sp.]
MPALFNPANLFGQPDRLARARPPILLVIGAHREELSFGEVVAEHLDHQRIGLLRIPVGLSGQRPGPDGLERYRQRHAELYRQILEHVQPGQRVLIDLHTGFDERQCSADVLCGEPALLRCIERKAAAEGRGSGGLGDMRPVRLIAADVETPPRSADARQTDAWPCVRPELPESVWKGAGLLYIGIEVYLAEPSAGTTAGTPAEARFAAAVIDAVGECALTVQTARSRQG